MFWFIINYDLVFTNVTLLIASNKLLSSNFVFVNLKQSFSFDY